MDPHSTIGELDTGDPPMHFEMVFEDGWRERLAEACKEESA
ncbi:MAG: hypothetical protein WD382_07715 [Halofilum sp. (in: g-proteobacteria)]